MERVSLLASLTFFLLAVGSWLKMGRRAVWVALALAALLYGVSALTTLLELHDLFLISVLVGFILFALAGFNVLFILEEMIYDAHRLIALRSPLWAIAPVAAVVAILIGLPFLEAVAPIRFNALRIVAIASLVLLALGWLTRYLTAMGRALTREIDLLVAGSIAGAALADAVVLLRETSQLLPTVMAYLAIIATWLYISFTTLQRAQYMLRANDVVPWLALFLSSSFAVLSHVQAQYRASGSLAFADLVGVRITYMVVGVWVGLAFFVVRGLWRILLYVQDEERVARPWRVAAGRMARVAEEALATDRRLGQMTYRVIERVERALPGERVPPQAPAYQRPRRQEGAPVSPEARSRQRGRSRRRNRQRPRG